MNGKFDLTCIHEEVVFEDNYCMKKNKPCLGRNHCRRYEQNLESWFNKVEVQEVVYG
jgi:hypothetical protein